MLNFRNMQQIPVVCPKINHWNHEILKSSLPPQKCSSDLDILPQALRSYPDAQRYHPLMSGREVPRFRAPGVETSPPSWDPKGLSNLPGNTKGCTPHVLFRHAGCNDCDITPVRLQMSELLYYMTCYHQTPGSPLQASQHYLEKFSAMVWQLVQGVSLPPTQCMLGETPSICKDVPVSLVILTSPHQLHPLVRSPHCVRLKCCHISLWRDICQKSI